MSVLVVPLALIVAAIELVILLKLVANRPDLVVGLILGRQVLGIALLTSREVVDWKCQLPVAPSC